jgi:hypothetical protein
MDKITTEKATDRWDLPHDYQAGDVAGSCHCGRRQSNTLHLPNMTLAEHASTSTRIETEKGTP